MAREITTVGVVGLGTMGAGIAEVFARTGFAVVGVERDDDTLAHGRGHIEHSTDRAFRRGKMSEDERAHLLDAITFTTDLDALAGCQLVVEAVPEQLDLKRDLFARLDKIVTQEAILATNTSSLSVTEISVATERPRRVVGMHFFNPAPVQEFVEVVRTVVTEPDWPAGSGRHPSNAATRRASSPTRSCSATSTTLPRCTTPATRRARTSTTPCGSAAATRWARSPCST